MPSTKDFRGKRLLTAITDTMDKMEGRYRRLFLEAIESLTNSSDLVEIVNDLRLGKITSLNSTTLARIASIQLNTADLTNAVRDAMVQGGKTTAKTVGLEGSFNLQNPRAIQAAQQLSQPLADVLNRTARENITGIISDAVEGIDSPAETARRIRNEIGLTKQHAQAVKNYRQTLTQSGMNKTQVQKRVDAYAKRLLKYRAETIARTEVSIAVNTGQREFWLQRRDDGSIPPTAMRVWIAELDSKVCDICEPLNGQLAPLDGDWATSAGNYSIPHAHPRCRCTSGLVFPSKITKDDPTGYEQWLLKGDFVGHPFRGNQWTGGRSGSVPKKSEAALDEHDAFTLSRQKIDSLPKNLSDAVDDYTANGYWEMNEHLRNPQKFRNEAWGDKAKTLDDQVDTLDKAFAKGSVECVRDMIVYRGMRLPTKKNQVLNSWLGRLKVGDVMEDQAFLSTTHNKKDTERFASDLYLASIVFTIKIPKGKKVLAGNESESELILNRGTKMRITKITQDTSEQLGGLQIEMEVV